ncbi:MAG TPA: hypothetical protein VF549_00950 [Solirubrobacteraceae bacterium]
MTPRALLLLLVAGLASAPPAHARAGDLDPSFGRSGVAIAAPRDGAELAALTLSAGRVVATGTTRRGACSAILIARWRPDGLPDRALDRDGMASPRTGPCSEAGLNGGFAPTAWPKAVAAAPDGRIFVAGATVPADRTRDQGLVSAYTPRGAFDASFSGDGWVADGFEQGAAGDVVRLPDGRLVVGGSAYGLRNYVEVHRYLPDGTPDPSFSGDGALDWGGRYESFMGAIVVAADGSAVVARGAGRPDVARSELAVDRLLPDGSFDPSFDVHIDLPGLSAQPFAAVRTPDGALVVAVHGSAEGREPASFLFRLRADGSLDPSFGGDGRIQVAPGAVELAVDPAGRLVVASAERRAAVVTRYLSGGAVDRSFGDRGNVEVRAVRRPRDVVVQPDGRIVVGGSAERDGTSAMVVARLLGGRRARAR